MSGALELAPAVTFPCTEAHAARGAHTYYTMHICEVPRGWPAGRRRPLRARHAWMQNFWLGAATRDRELPQAFAHVMQTMGQD